MLCLNFCSHPLTVIPSLPFSSLSLTLLFSFSLLSVSCYLLPYPSFHPVCLHPLSLSMSLILFIPHLFLFCSSSLSLPLSVLSSLCLSLRSPFLYLTCHLSLSLSLTFSFHPSQSVSLSFLTPSPFFIRRSLPSLHFLISASSASSSVLAALPSSFRLP